MRVPKAGITSPSAADCADTERSSSAGAVTDPATALFTYRRLRLPSAQRRPSPKFTGEISTSPCRKIESAVARSPADVSTSVSLERLGVPVELSCAPPVEIEFSQPWKGAPAFPHGQAEKAPLPKQKLVTGPPPPGTSPLPTIAAGTPIRHRPIEIDPVTGAASASKRKLYIVPQRIALARSICACVSVDQVTSLAPCTAVQSAAEKLMLPEPSPSW